MKRYIRYLSYLFIIIWICPSIAQSYDDFFRAVELDDGRTVSGWLERGFDPNARDPRGQTALHLALRDGSFRVAEALWKAPSLDVNAANADLESPLMMAALRGRLDWVQRLIERGARIQLPGWSPIHYAATGPEPKVVALLLDKGATLEAPSPNRTTPLMMAAGYGPEESVNLLLARGASLRARNDRDFDAAAFARMSGRDFLLARLAAPPPRSLASSAPGR